MEDTVRARPPADLKVIETMRWDRASGFARFERHLSRCAATCQQFGIPFEAEAVRAALHRAATGAHMRVRLTIDLSGQIEVKATELAGEPPATPWRIALSDHRLRAGDPWLRVKTTKREIYDRARRELPAHLNEIIFANERDEICEGTITNLFFDFGDGLITPPVSSGVLPGVLRAELLAEGKCREGLVKLADLDSAEAIWAGNSVRGLIHCRLVGQASAPIANAGK
ncbi:aminotransferase class IV family protein [Dichotomicrobium thermohalophilum]|uniref:Probable branched-chain-amino-acid aminotransferase n=1 Tax=Dichotomicrobium thermohalophilum TaxID=933063 RepID=A0A397Q3W4_9HYPH|nr:aminotransferase class IV family protein [Dichotomicrobium thermohalophilum]RIA55812.1 4-amino-4-deoxychorismate lyase [Dichotomicrobium thermohalophilum]